MIIKLRKKSGETLKSLEIHHMEYHVLYDYEVALMLYNTLFNPDKGSNFEDLVIEIDDIVCNNPDFQRFKEIIQHIPQERT